MDEEVATFHGPGWKFADGLAVRGRGFDATGAEADLVELYRNVDTYESIIQTTRGLSGFFSVVRETPDAIYLVCDHARSIPLYFSDTATVAVSDTATGAATTEQAVQFDPIAESEFVLTRYVTRGETLLPAVKSVRAGEIVRVPRDEPSSFNRTRYVRYRPTTRLDGDRNALLDRMATVLDDVFGRTAEIVGNRPVVVPLSGGIDSRLVATLLVEQGCDVTGFTFGRRGHADVEVSRNVANALGIDWEWVEYSPDRWHEWYHSTDRLGYHDSAFNYDSLPFLAEWPAIRELIRTGRLPEDAIVCPGHTVTTPSERVPGGWLNTTPGEEEFLDYVLDTHYSLWDWDDADARRAFEPRIVADASLGSIESGAHAAAAYEQWEWTNRMTTFTNGDLRLYDWFDLDWWLPLWDPAFVRFWSSVPLRERHEKSLQTAFTAQKYADVADIDQTSASRTDRDWTPFDQIRRTFQTHPIATHEGGFESWMGAQAQPRSQWERWGNYPLGWYGIIRERDADRFAPARNLYALRTLEAIDRVSFDPPWIADPPLTRKIDLPPSGADANHSIHN